MSRRPFVFVDSFGAALASASASAGPSGSQVEAYSWIIYSNFTASNQIHFRIYHNRGGLNPSFTNRSWSISLNGSIVNSGNSGSDFNDIYATVPSTGYFEVGCTVFTATTNGLYNTSAAAICFFQVYDITGTVNVVQPFTPPNVATRYLRVLRINTDAVDGQMFFFKNTSTVDDVVISSNNNQNIDGQNYFIRLERFRGITLIRSSSAYYILSFYENTFTNSSFPFTITKAQYGSTPTSGADVTTTVRNSYESGASSIAVNNGTFGDPQPGVFKYLWVDYTANGTARPQLVTGEGGTFSYSSMTFPSGVGIATATSTVVILDISSANKSVVLPAASVGSLLVIFGYTTSTSTINRINILGDGKLGDTQTNLSLRPAAGPACAIVFVSNGTRWYVVGTFAGTNTVYDGFTGGGPVSPTVVVSVTSTNDSITLPSITIDGDSQVFFFKTTNIQYGNGAVIFANSGGKAVNETYGRFYRSGNTPGSAYVALSTKLAAWNQSRVLPVSMYPSEY